MLHASDTRADASKPYGPVAQAHYADPGYQKDGKARYPLDSERHCRAAWSYINKAENAAPYTPDQLKKIKARIMAAGKRYGIDFETPPPSAAGHRGDLLVVTETRDIGTCVRSFDFDVQPSGDGRTLEGYVAVFNASARIADRSGDFDEEIKPGAFDRSLRTRGFPIMQWDHGKDPRVGTVPIGVYDTFERDGKGYRVRGRLLDNPVVEPVRQAIAAGAIRGMSFRFAAASNGGDRWTKRSGQIDKRDILDADVLEAGPVAFPAYAATSVGVRSDELDPAIRAALVADIVADLSTTDFTGRPRTWSAGGGDYDATPREGSAPTNPSTEARERALRLLRQPIVLP